MNETLTLQTSIEARGLSKVYWDGDRPLEIFRRVSLSVRQGESIAILGPSGSGKTTLLNLLSGLDEPSEGQVRLGGVLLNGLSERDRALLRNRVAGFVFQFYYLLPEFTALENVMLPAMIRPRPRPQDQIRDRARVLLEQFGLGQRLRHFPGELSGGEQQRVAIARALINDPNILFCDEPTGNLDAKMGSEIAELLSGLSKQHHKTVLMVTHDERIAGMADRVWNIAGGLWQTGELHEP